MINPQLTESEFLYGKEELTTFTSAPYATVSETLSDRTEQNVYSLPFGKLYIESYSENWIEPDWLLPTLGALQKLYCLDPNWDSYGALKIDTKSLESTLLFLLEFLPHNAPMPAIIPTPAGNVQVEWHESGIDLEIEIRAHGVYEFYFFDAQKDVESEEIFTGNFAPLCDHIKTLVQRS